MRKQEAKDNEQLTQDEVDRLIMTITSRTRCHPDVTRGASVRGAIAFKEVAHGFNEMRNKLTRSIIQRAALITLPPRISVKQGGYESAVTVVDEIAKEVLYGIRFSRPSLQTVLAEGIDWMNPEDIMTALENLHLTQMYLEEKHELTQKEEAAIVSTQKHDGEVPEHLQSKDVLQEEKGDPYLSVEKVLEHLMEELDYKLARGEITKREFDREKHKLKEMLNAVSYIQSQMSDKELTETVMELMDAQDKRWDKEVSQECMYIYYHMKGMREGLSLGIHKRGYYGLRVLIDALVRQRILKTVTPGKAFNLTAEALDILLDRIIPKNWKGSEFINRIGWSKAQVNEHQHDIRRYTFGDMFRDISVRHTLREIAKQKKKLSDVQRRDFRVFMRQHRELQSDIVLCVDTSGSMGFRQKLTYARLVAAGLARVALKDGDRIGIVAFDDLGEMVMPLTDNREEIFSYIAGLNVGGNTNIGDGIKCATRLLLNNPSYKQKHIVLITDGEPTAIPQEAFEQLRPARGKDLAEEYAILETRRASSSGIRTSVIHIAGHREAGQAFVKNVATVGKGRVQKIDFLEDLKAIMR